METLLGQRTLRLFNQSIGYHGEPLLSDSESGSVRNTPYTSATFSVLPPQIYPKTMVFALFYRHINNLHFLYIGSRWALVAPTY